ncbi:MAG TPA: maltotransferase domain-containing protein [Fibrobacteria bacterium]|nr:maltotransferase domain-containing protein [Fibrobacteria bacterium]
MPVKKLSPVPKKSTEAVKGGKVTPVEPKGRPSKAGVGKASVVKAEAEKPLAGKVVGGKRALPSTDVKMESAKAEPSKERPGKEKAIPATATATTNAKGNGKPAAKQTANGHRASGAASAPTTEMGSGPARTSEVTINGGRGGKTAPIASLPMTPASVARAAHLAHPSVPAIHAVVENLQPMVDGGRFPIKAVPGESIVVTADIFRDGHEQCEAVLLFRPEGESRWQRAPMEFVDNDQWRGRFTAYKPGNFEFTVEARTKGHSNVGEVPFVDTPYQFQPYGTLRVDSALVEYSAWYEMWAKSQGKEPGKSATFKDMTERLDDIQGMGFDVIYLPPIHPIGVTKRKGANNALVAKPGEPGCPYAIGNSHGGHKAVDPELGSTPEAALAECRKFIRDCRDRGFAVALDFALNCSPDHPYVKDHPDWYYREQDGTIKCAENPPKRYEDVYPLNFFCEDRENLWNEIKSILEFWMDMGVTIFRVDNPHTKPFVFWEWVIREIKKKNPEIIFLSEAFTRPKIMKRLAKLGFDLSYTYFTWRTSAQEMREYLEELTQSPCKEYMKPIFFATTPDILPWHLQNAPASAFKIRHALACTLSGCYGMYNGFELCEGTPVPGKEEFLNSEKYQYKVWDWDRPGNIKGFIRRLNEIRRDNRALHHLKNLRFHSANNPNILVYSKHLEENILLFVLNMDPHNKQAATVSLDLPAMGLASENIYGLYDLLSHESYVWSGPHNYVELTPSKEVMHVFKIEKF